MASSYLAAAFVLLVGAMASPEDGGDLWLEDVLPGRLREAEDVTAAPLIVGLVD